MCVEVRGQHEGLVLSLYHVRPTGELGLAGLAVPLPTEPACFFQRLDVRSELVSHILIIQ